MATVAQPKVKLYWLNDSRSKNTLWLLEELGIQYEVQVFRRQPNRLAPPELQAVHPLGRAPVLEITPSSAPGAPGEAPHITLAESGYITQYLLEHFGQNKPSLVPRRWKDDKANGGVGGETEAYRRFWYLLHYVEGSFMPTIVQYLLFSILKSAHVPFLVRPITSAAANKIMSAVVLPDAKKHLAMLEDFLRTAPSADDDNNDGHADDGGETERGGGFLCGPHLTAADILISFALEIGAGKSGGGGGAFDDMGSWPGGSARAAHPLVFEYLDRLRREPGYLRAKEKAREIEGR